MEEQVGTKRLRGGDEDIENQKSTKKIINGCEGEVAKEVIVILDAGAQYGKVGLGVANACET